MKYGSPTMTQAAVADRRPQQRHRPGQPVADPRRADAAGDVERARLGLVRARVALDERHPVRHAQRLRPRAAPRQEHVRQVDADPAAPEPLRPAAEHLALAAGEVQDPRPGPDPGDLAQEAELLVRERVEDPLVGLGDLVVAERHA